MRFMRSRVTSRYERRWSKNCLSMVVSLLFCQAIQFSFFFFFFFSLTNGACSNENGETIYQTRKRQPWPCSLAPPTLAVSLASPHSCALETKFHHLH